MDGIMYVKSRLHSLDGGQNETGSATLKGQWWSLNELLIKDIGPNKGEV